MFLELAYLSIELEEKKAPRQFYILFLLIYHQVCFKGSLRILKSIVLIYLLLVVIVSLKCFQYFSKQMKELSLILFVLPTAISLWLSVLKKDNNHGQSAQTQYKL